MNIKIYIMRIFGIIFFISLLAFISCSNNNEDSLNLMKDTEEAPTKSISDEEAGKYDDANMEETAKSRSRKNSQHKNEDITKNNVENDEVKIPEKIIKKANISFEVKNYKKSKVAIDMYVKKWKAYISNENEINENYRINNDIVIRVSKKNFELLVKDIMSESKKTDYKRISATDVTEEYVDIVSRLKTKKEVEKRYYDILNKAKTISEILMVEEKIRYLREEIEAKEGKLKYIDDRVGFSTINLSMYETLDFEYVAEASPNFFEKLSEAVHTGWKGLLGLIIGLFYIWPLLLFFAVVLFFVLKYIKKNKINIKTMQKPKTHNPEQNKQKVK